MCRRVCVCVRVTVHQDAGRNSDLGEREASFHDYKVLVLHMASKLNPFLLCESDKPERVTRYASSCVCVYVVARAVDVVFVSSYALLCCHLSSRHRAVKR